MYSHSEKLCSKQAKQSKRLYRPIRGQSPGHGISLNQSVTSCHLVEVNLHAFLAPTASVCQLPSALATNSVEV